MGFVHILYVGISSIIVEQDRGESSFSVRGGRFKI